MSILLKALKKSEQQRQLGATPTLSTPVETHSADSQDERRWLPVAMLALSAIVMAWIGWNQYRPPFSVIPKLSKAQSASVSLDSEEPDIEESAVAVQSPEPALPSEARTLVESFQPEEPASDDALVAADSTPVESDRRQQGNQTFRIFNPGSLPENTAPTEPPDESAAPVESGGRTAELAATPQAVPAADSPASMKPYTPEPISYWEVPQSVRENMPEFKISVLVFAENPEDRFLLINGQRLAEKEDYMDGVQLDEIRRDGAVFIYRKYRFLVKG